jgi:hypothetical protein
MNLESGNETPGPSAVRKIANLFVEVGVKEIGTPAIPQAITWEVAGTIALGAFLYALPVLFLARWLGLPSYTPCIVIVSGIFRDGETKTWPERARLFGAAATVAAVVGLIAQAVRFGTERQMWSGVLLVAICLSLYWLASDAFVALRSRRENQT